MGGERDNRRLAIEGSQRSFPARKVDRARISDCLIERSPLPGVHGNPRRPHCGNSNRSASHGLITFHKNMFFNRSKVRIST